MATEDQLAGLRERYRFVLRARRTPVLEALDHQYSDAFDRGADIALISEARIALRDAPANPAIEEASTVADLAAIWPAALGEFPTGAFEGWAAPPERPGVHVVVDLAPKEAPPVDPDAPAPPPAEGSVDHVALILAKRRLKAEEEAKRPPPEPRRQRVTGRRK